MSYTIHIVLIIFCCIPIYIFTYRDVIHCMYIIVHTHISKHSNNLRHDQKQTTAMGGSGAAKTLCPQQSKDHPLPSASPRPRVSTPPAVPVCIGQKYHGLKLLGPIYTVYDMYDMQTVYIYTIRVYIYYTCIYIYIICI